MLCPSEQIPGHHVDVVLSKLLIFTSKADQEAAGLPTDATHSFSEYLDAFSTLSARLNSGCANSKAETCECGSADCLDLTSGSARGVVIVLYTC